MKTRILSAIILIALVVPLTYFGGKSFSLAICLISMLAYKELLGLKCNKNKIPILMQIFGFICTVCLVIGNTYFSYEFGLNYKVVIFTILIHLLPLLFYDKDNYNSKDAFYLMGISLLIGTTFNAFILVRAFGLYQFIYLIIIPVITDTFAMLCGMIMGKHKLCPNISPKKTWEGSIGGSIIGTAAASVFYHFFIHKISLIIVVITLGLSIIGQLGDLVFSRIKRDNDAKDYSNLIPGHGGILDRLDSIIFVVLFYLILHSFI